MGDSLDSSGEPSPETQHVAVVEFPAFAVYLRKSLTILHPDEEAVPPALNLALDDKNNQECVRKFLADPQVWALYIQRSSSKGKIDPLPLRIINGTFFRGGGDSYVWQHCQQPAPIFFFFLIGGHFFLARCRGLDVSIFCGNYFFAGTFYEL